MDVDVVVERVIPVARERVAEFAGDPSNAPRWYANIRSVAWRTEPPVAIGSRMDFEARFLGRPLAYTYEVTELVAGERMVMRTADGAVRLAMDLAPPTAPELPRHVAI